MSRTNGMNAKKAMIFRTFLVLLITTLIANNEPVLAYSQGAPTRACTTMVPGHGSDSQTGPAPYALLVQPTHKGAALSVSIVANTGHSLTGFMLQSRHAVNRNQIIDGIFSEDKQSQIKSCNANRANTLTHRSGSPKTKIVSVWTPPDSYTGDVIFRATIVKTKETFWTEQDSGVFKFTKGIIDENRKYLSNVEEMNTNDVNIVNNNKENSESFPADSGRATHNPVLNYSVCDYKFCLGLGQGSDCIKDKSCELLLSGGYVNKEEGLTEFYLSAIPKSGTHLSKYYSMAFSEDNKMGDDLVTDCYVTSDGKVKVGSSYNLGQHNELNDEHKDSLHSISANYLNGIVVCKWRSNRKRTVSEREWDLLDRKYHILLSMGELEDDNGKKNYHDARLATNEAVSLESTGAISATDLVFLVRIHGSFMVIAWVGTVSLAIVLARYYKNTWVSSTLCGVKIWFAFHRGLMVTSVLLMLIAQICIFYYLKEYRIGLHQLLGSLAFVIALLNPIGALLRPHPEAANRWLFNWGHWLLGNIGHITAFAAIFLATNLSLADLPKPFLWTMISFVIFNVFIHLILQFHTFFMQNRKTHDIALQDMSRSSDDNDMGTDGPGSGFRRFILGIYCVVISGFVIAMVSLISLPKSTLEMMAIT